MSTKIKALFLALLVLGLDQISKFFVLEALTYQQIIKLNNFCNLLLVWNKGITFGLFDGVKYITDALNVVVIIITLGLIWWLIRAKNLIDQYGLAMVIGGALGNITDRLRFGAVIDFIDLHIAGYHWYVFNIADSAICVAVFMMLFAPYIYKKQVK